ncbi:uroporphyrin-III C-methyltransferase [Thecaphora frezii]
MPQAADRASASTWQADHSSPPFPAPTPTASLILSHRPPPGKVALILGTGKLAASRCFACLEAGIRPIVIDVQHNQPASTPPSDSASDPLESERVCDEIRYRVRSNTVSWKTVSYSPPTADAPTDQAQSIRHAWNQLLDELDEGEANSIFIVCITDTLHSGDGASQPAIPGPASSSAAPPLTPYQRAEIVAGLCRKRRILINVADKPDLCDFSFPAAHRFPCLDPTSSSVAKGNQPTQSPLQIAVTTNGRGCRLAGRIRREIVSALPRNIGDAVEKVGRMRDMAKQEDLDHALPGPSSSAAEAEAVEVLGNATSVLPKKQRKPREKTASGAFKDIEEDDLSFDTTPLNSPVPQLTFKNPIDSAGLRLRAALTASAAQHTTTERVSEDAIERTKRRMRWVAQISEYWPIEYLGGLKGEQMNNVLSTYADVQPKGDAPREATLGAQAKQSGAAAAATTDEDCGRPSTLASTPDRQTRARSRHSLVIHPPMPARQKKGHIYLLGSGTGHPGLLTVLAHRLLSSPDTHLILSDKLVPASILRLIPPTTPLEIAKKFPGNAEGAQSELIALALKAAIEEGKTVVRLKQGDPFVYGRGGEEVLAFRRAGIECTVVPGISSALAAPLMLGIPVTQRGAADSLVLCTGVGRGGKRVRLPGYERGRTLVVLMGVARLKAVVQTLTGNNTLGRSSNDDDVSSSIGDRDGAPFPPYTPIAIIERASSSDQRMVASTLEGIVEALERSGEQRPPGMMVIGWAVLSLEGEGDVGISDDATECSVPEAADAASQAAGEAELERRDRKRIEAWLGGKRSIVREGLDEAYRKALDQLVSTSSSAESHVAAAAAEGEKTSKIGWTKRDQAGWAGPRYADGRPEGGWGAEEAPNRPAKDEMEHAQHREYVEVRARLAKMDA